MELCAPLSLLQLHLLYSPQFIMFVVVYGVLKVATLNVTLL
jgi:hypothetical protein